MKSDKDRSYRGRREGEAPKIGRGAEEKLRGTGKPRIRFK